MVQHDLIFSTEHGALRMGDYEDATSGVRSGSHDVVVFCAMELPVPPAPPHRRVRVHGCPLDDAHLTREEIARATETARHVARSVASGSDVLVTCAQGRNRSGLVTALALHALTGCGGAAAVRQVRERRLNALGPALTNVTFVHYLITIRPAAVRR